MRPDRGGCVWRGEGSSGDRGRWEGVGVAEPRNLTGENLAFMEKDANF